MNPTTTFAPGDLVEFVDDYGPDGLHAKKGDRVTVAWVAPTFRGFPGFDPLVHFEESVSAAYAHRLRKVAPVVTAKPDFAKGDRVVFGEDYGSVCRQGDTGLITKVRPALGLPEAQYVTVLRDADHEPYEVYSFRLRKAPEVHPEPEALEAKEGDRVVVVSPVYTFLGETYDEPNAKPGDQGVVQSPLDADGDYGILLDNGQDVTVTARGVVMAPPAYAVGDLVTVTSQAPTFQGGGGAVYSSAKTGETYRVFSVCEDGDLGVEVPETGAWAACISPEHVEPYIAPAIRLRSSVDVQAAHLNGWATVLSSPGHAFVEFAPSDLTPYLDALDKAVADLRAAIEKGA